MGTGRDLFNSACTFLGEPYSTAPGRTSPTSGYKDCSGLVAAAYEITQGYELGAYVSVTIYAQSERQGLAIPFDYARNIVGACILKPENPYLGWGSAGHIAISDGAGGTCEATPPRVQRLSLAYNWPWSTHACLLPGLDYANNGEGAPAEPPSTSKRRHTGMTVGWINLAFVGGGIAAYLIGGSHVIVHEFHGPPSAYGIPQDAADFAANTNCGLFELTGDEWERLLRNSGVIG